jgi:predicted permease
MRQNIEYAVRGLKRSPGFTAAVVVTLALGIGANATMFGVVDRLMLSAPPHIVKPNQVRRLRVEMRSPRTGRLYRNSTVSYPDLKDWEASESFESVAGYGSAQLTLGHGTEAERVEGLSVTASYFPLLGVRPQLGRFFDPAEDQAGAAGVAVLSHALWQSLYGGDPGVLGRLLPLGKGSYTVIGVAPRGFTGVDLQPVDFWLPMHARTAESGSDEWVDARRYYIIETIVRLRPGVSPEAAESEATYLHRIGRREDAERGRYDPEARILTAPVLRARGPEVSGVSVASLFLAGVSLVVLVIACANVANLLLARASQRKREIAIRLAMGISRRRLVGQLLTESVLLAGMGGLAALLIAIWGGGLMRSLLLPHVAWIESPVNPRVLAFTAFVALATGLSAGLIPALQASRPNLTDSLKSGAREGSGRRSRTRLALAVTQGALSVVLLIGAGLAVRSLNKVKSVDLGLDAQNVVLARLELERGHVSDEELTQTYQLALQRLQGHPAVEHAGLMTAIPFATSWAEQIFVPGVDSLAIPGNGVAWGNSVTPDFFATLRIQIRQGRAFTAADVSGGEPVAIVDETMARGLAPDGNALGMCFSLISRDEPCRQVVGVVGDSRRYRVIEGETWQYYLPLEQAPEHMTPSLLIRGRMDPVQIVPIVKSEIQGAIPDVRFVETWAFQSWIDPQFRSYRLGATMVGAFGLLALIVASVGLYSLLAFNVARRSHEIGVRSALGASRGKLVALILKEAVGVAVVGLLIGLGIALAAGGSVANLIYGISPRDPLVFGTVTATLLAVAVAAGAIPAWRAVCIDPNVALRVE